ncbi:MAG: hypothetical protein COA94_00780 [Rickettsiales bacterium]|nr:MAG: hypothetical protein COA94_00780 [Rickettsiales bacterium]
MKTQRVQNHIYNNKAKSTSLAPAADAAQAANLACPSSLAHCFLLIVFALCFCPPQSFANTGVISEIFIEASGNNKHEARIKAHELGMQRALFLVADKINIPTDDLSPVPYEDLRQVFKPITIADELSLSEKYIATVTYSYDQGKLYNLLLEYGNEEINDLFYEALIIPVLKQGITLNVWNDDKKWHDIWGEHRDSLNEYKIFYPEKTLYLENKINSANLRELNYDDFTKIFHGKLFKKVIIISGEFFTNRRTAKSLLRVRHYAHGQEEESMITEKDYDLKDWSDIANTIDLIVTKLIDSEGKTRTTEPEEMAENEDVFHNPMADLKQIMMDIDVFDQEELDLVTAKLAAVKEIESFKISHSYESRYKILIYTSSSEYALAEGLYLNGLSYKIHGNLYNLIDIKKGG